MLGFFKNSPATGLLIILIVLSFISLTAAPSIKSAKANFMPMPPIVEMPNEYINVTIYQAYGVTWAKVDGTYPMHRLVEPGQTINNTIYIFENLLMIYPLPPETVNFSVKIDGTPLTWTNVTQSSYYDVYRTVIGDWSVVALNIFPVPENFTLTTHYEHPVLMNDGNYTFLYPLITAPYLSALGVVGPNSTAHFNVRFEIDSTDLYVYTVEKMTRAAWSQVEYDTRTEGAARVISFDVVSEKSSLNPPPFPTTDVVVSNSPPVNFQHGSSPFSLAINEEIINATISFADKTLWAKVDEVFVLDNLGYMTVRISNAIAHNSTNISLHIGEKSLDWAYSGKNYLTVMGNWSIITSTISPTPDWSLVRIHQEYPVPSKDGNYTFLYPLIADPYTTPWVTKSIAHIRVRFEAPSTNISTYSVQYAETLDYSNETWKWTPVNSTETKENSITTVILEIKSELGKQLPDLAITFTGVKVPESGASSTLPSEYGYVLAAAAAVLIAIATGYMYMLHKNSQKRFIGKNRNEPKVGPHSS